MSLVNKHTDLQTYTLFAVALPQVITTLNTGKMYYCGVFHPEDDKQNVLMGGCGDKKIYQFDLNTGEVEQVNCAGLYMIASCQQSKIETDTLVLFSKPMCCGLHRQSS